jgi:hypothetical protein
MMLKLPHILKGIGEKKRKIMTKKKTASSSASTITGTSPADLVARDIETIAAKLEMPPWNLKHYLYINNGGQYNLGNGSLLTNLGGWRKIINTYFPTPVCASAKLAMSELRQEHNKVVKSIGSYDIFLEELEKILGKLPPIKVMPYKFGRNIKTQRALAVVVSDLHIGHDVDPEETNHSYGVIEESRVVAHVVRTACEYKRQHRDETELHLFLLGDMIENKLHGASSADLLHLQTCRAMWLLSQMIGQFAQNFKKVHVYCVTGNHDRDTSIHPKRAIHQKYNSIGTTIYYGVHMSVRNLENVVWHQPKTPWIDTTILGHRVYGTHGDTNFCIGNVGKSINTSTIESRMNKINASLRDRDEYEVFLTAHVHTGLFLLLNNGCNLVVNGGGLPPDAFVTSMDIMETPQCQALFEITPEYAVGDRRFIDMTGVFKDTSLDKIIVPFKGLED